MRKHAVPYRPISSGHDYIHKNIVVRGILSMICLLEQAFTANDKENAEIQKRHYVPIAGNETKSVQLPPQTGLFWGDVCLLYIKPIFWREKAIVENEPNASRIAFSRSQKNLNLKCTVHSYTFFKDLIIKKRSRTAIAFSVHKKKTKHAPPTGDNNSR